MARNDVRLNQTVRFYPPPAPPGSSVKAVVGGAYDEPGHQAANCKRYPLAVCDETIRRKILFLRSLLLTGNRLTLALTGAGVGLGALTANGQAFTVTETAVAGDIQEAL